MTDRPKDLLATTGEPAPDDSPPVRIEEVDGRAVATVEGTDEILRCDPSAVVEPER